VTYNLLFGQAPPRNWDQFEELCADTFQEEWRDTMLVRHGRAGQPQFGVDIVGRDGAIWPVGIQCKKKSVWPVSKLTTAELDEEVEKAKGFKPELHAFYVITTAPDDQPLQEHVRLLNERHDDEGLFPVAVIGWRELVRRATRHTSVAAKHFGAFSQGPASPLLATWRAADGRLLLGDRELGISIQELIHDIRDYPAGRFVIRQAESEDLLLRIKERQSTGQQTHEIREGILELRDALKRRVDGENRAVAGLRLLLSHKYLPDLFRLVWRDQAPIAVRSFVENELRLHVRDVKDLEKVRLFPPGQLGDDNARSCLMPPGGLTAVFEHQAQHRRRWKKAPVQTVDEMPDSVKFGHAIPTILDEILKKMEEGMSPEEVEQRGLLDIAAWKYSF
jgi:hypothetical protein